jgi:hypothetical protein
VTQKAISALNNADITDTLKKIEINIDLHNTNQDYIINIDDLNTNITNLTDMILEKNLKDLNDLKNSAKKINKIGRPRQLHEVDLSGYTIQGFVVKKNVETACTIICITININSPSESIYKITAVTKPSKDDIVSVSGKFVCLKPDKKVKK